MEGTCCRYSRFKEGKENIFVTMLLRLKLVPFDAERQVPEEGIYGCCATV